MRTLVRVPHHVQLKRISCREGSRTTHASIRLQTFVYVPDVFIPAARASEPFSTVCAQEPAFTRMRAQMVSQLAGSYKAETAFSAEERTLVGMKTTPVFGEVVAPSKLPTAVRALELRSPVQSHMNLESTNHLTTDRTQLRYSARVTSCRRIYFVPDYITS